MRTERYLESSATRCPQYGRTRYSPYTALSLEMSDKEMEDVASSHTTEEDEEPEEAAPAAEPANDELEDDDEDGTEDDDQGEGPEASPKSEVPPEEAMEGAEEDDKPQEPSYSTRGRSTTDTDPLERLAREALGDLREKEPTSSLRESFLSDAISEEERRTRTRYIPDVEGMHALRKHEVKGDLQLARSNFSSSGVASTLAAKAKKDDDVMEDDRASDAGVRAGSKTIEIGAAELVLPSPAFVAPPTSESKQVTSPRQVEAVTAFNPPRPPESIGAKKKHRMLRWERRPADIEVDLKKYRKTVEKARDELKSAEAECERLEAVDNHLRRHFLGHLQCQNEEWIRLNKELAVVQQECVNAADLLTSRTRSRGAGKSSHAMRDVLTVLRARGQEMTNRGIAIPAKSVEEPAKGAGGVGFTSLHDWTRTTAIEVAPMASEWVVPGDAVKTVYGQGTVVAVFGPAPLDVDEKPHKDLVFGHAVPKSPSAMDVDDADDTAATPKSNVEADGKTKKKPKKKENGSAPSSRPKNFIVAPRVAVRLPFGVGFFPIESVTSLEDTSTYSDDRLAQRWKGLAETAVAMGPVLDVQAMADLARTEAVLEANALELEEGAVEKQESTNKVGDRLLPFGSGLFPTASGRGATLWKQTLDELEKAIDDTIFTGTAVLGRKDNPGVTNEVRMHEDEHQELIDLKAETLQLKNELYRQRRVRMLNERTYAATQERAVRVEALVHEMRTDLKTLKRRLDEEVAELGISEDEAEKILTSFYNSLDNKHSGEASPPKRPRRMSRLPDEDDEMMDEEEEDKDEPISASLLQVAAAAEQS